MTFHFNGYTLRPVLKGDRDYLTRLIEADPYHKDKMNAGWFLDLGPGEGAWAMENERGEVVLYLKTQNAVRLSIQFGEQGSDANRDALIKGLAWLEETLFLNGFCELIFDSDSPVLWATARRRLGFAMAHPGTMVKAVGVHTSSDASTGLGSTSQRHYRIGGEW
jgi:hypothetical protein